MCNVSKERMWSEYVLDIYLLREKVVELYNNNSLLYSKGSSILRKFSRGNLFIISCDNPSVLYIQKSLTNHWLRFEVVNTTAV